MSDVITYICPMCHKVVSVVRRVDETLCGDMEIYTCAKCGIFLAGNLIEPEIFDVSGIKRKVTFEEIFGK